MLSEPRFREHTVKTEKAPKSWSKTVQNEKRPGRMELIAHHAGPSSRSPARTPAGRASSWGRAGPTAKTHRQLGGNPGRWPHSTDTAIPKSKVHKGRAHRQRGTEGWGASHPLTSQQRAWPGPSPLPPGAVGTPAPAKSYRLSPSLQPLSREHPSRGAKAAAVAGRGAGGLAVGARPLIPGSDRLTCAPPRGPLASAAGRQSRIRFHLRPSGSTPVPPYP